MIDTIIKSVKLTDQRYETLGDYYLKDGKRIFSITKTGNDLFDDLIFIHEFIEEVLTRNKGINEEQILKYDLEFEDKIRCGEVDENDEPGEQIDSPYRQEHMIAEIVERLIANHLNINFKEYDNKLINLFKDANS